MESTYQWFGYGHVPQTKGLFTWFSNETNLKRVIDIMAAPIQDQQQFKNDVSPLLLGETILCIGGELKAFGDGNPCSNFRNNDPVLNENVIRNYFRLFESYKSSVGKPIFITSIPRSWRSYSWLIQGDGSIIRKDQDFRRRADDPMDSISYHGFPGGDERASDQPDEKLMNFLDTMNVSVDNLKKIRKSCKGAKYHTYLIDMISFLYQMKIDADDFHSLFSPDYRSLSSILGGKQIGSWVPNPDTFYFYQNKSIERDGYLFYTPTKDSIKIIYDEFYEAISLEDNEMKEQIRKYCSNTYIHRWSDFDVNDTDDSFTILMIIHAFNVKEELTDEENQVKEKMESQMKFWFDQL